ILFGGAAAYADGTRELSTQQDRNPAFNRQHIWKGEDGRASAGKHILENFGRALEQDRAAGFANRDLDTGEQGVVHSLKMQQIGTGVDDRDAHRAGNSLSGFGGAGSDPEGGGVGEHVRLSLSLYWRI